MSTKSLNHAQTLTRYSELMHLIDAGAYEERNENGDYGADGIEQGVADLDFMAAKQGLEFHFHKDTNSYTLEPMSPADMAAFKTSQAAEREERAQQGLHDNWQNAITPSQFDDEWEMNNR